MIIGDGPVIADAIGFKCPGSNYAGSSHMHVLGVAALLFCRSMSQGGDHMGDVQFKPDEQLGTKLQSTS
jgi:hypothetical protein